MAELGWESFGDILWNPDTGKLIWKKQEPRKPNRVRAIRRPALAHDPEWTWDGNSVILTKGKGGPTREECDEEPEGEERILRPPADLSLFDIARYRVDKKRRKAKTPLGDFELIEAASRVLPISEEEFADLDIHYEDDEWEKVDATGIKRTYSHVLRGSQGKDPLK